MTSGTIHLDVSRELEMDCEPWTVIQENEVRIHYKYLPYVPAQGPSYASGGQPEEGGYAEFYGASVLGNRGKWIELQPADPLYQWAEQYLRDNDDEFKPADDCDDGAYDRWRDERMERRFA